MMRILIGFRKTESKNHTTARKMGAFAIAKMRLAAGVMKSEPMTFRSLKIEAEQYGANKGKLIATISLSGEKSQTTMELPPEVGEAVLRLAKNAIIDGVEKAANDFIFEITTSIPETMNLTNQ